jgi:hypothetical protein
LHPSYLLQCTQLSHVYGLPLYWCWWSSMSYDKIFFLVSFLSKSTNKAFLSWNRLVQWNIASVSARAGHIHARDIEHCKQYGGCSDAVNPIVTNRYYKTSNFEIILESTVEVDVSTRWKLARRIGVGIICVQRQKPRPLYDVYNLLKNISKFERQNFSI